MFNKIKSTKKKSFCEIIGSKKDLCLTKLPTAEDILKYYLWLDPKCALKKLCEKVCEIWKIAGIPTVSRPRIMTLLKSLYTRYKLIKRTEHKINNPTLENKIKKFKSEIKALFDIAKCKCYIQSCECSENHRVPDNKRMFLLDQRTTRNMKITQTQIIRQIRNVKSISTDNTEENASGSDPDFSIRRPKNRSKVKSKNQYNTMDIKKVAIVCDRYRISDRAGAAIATSGLQSVGAISENNTMLVVDKNKIRRAREKVRTTLQNENMKAVIGVYFDGKVDRTLCSETSDGFLNKNIIKSEEHISIIGEPNTQYIGHATLTSGSSRSIVNGVSAVLEHKEISGFLAIGCDGTNVNTGLKTGVIRSFEEKLGYPLQWIICQLHTNELPLRHIFNKLDGKTCGPTGFSGPLGKNLKNSVKLDVVNFAPIKADILEINSSDLSKDQQYLLEICKAVTSGKCDKKLAKKNPGPISHSRWLTLANHVLRTYIGTLSPSDTLTTLAKFIVKVYAPMWFQIKLKNKCVNGAVNVWKTIECCRYLPEDLRQIVFSVIERNSYFAHPENILIAMVVDNRRNIRKMAVQHIIEARCKQSNNVQVRQFLKPKIYFEADEYWKMIDWSNINITVPPLLNKYDEHDLNLYAENDSFKNLPELSLPCHSQAVERCVKLVSEASQVVAGYNRRDGFIRTRIKSREAMPTFNTKSDFRV